MKRALVKYLLFFSISLLLLSCSGEKKDDYLQNDQSFASKWYVQYGVSDYSRNWSFNDYSYAIQILSGIQTKYPFSLPRLNSKKSGILFEKFVSDKNFSFLNDSISLREKARSLLKYSNRYDDLVDLYYSRPTETQYYNRELIEIYIFGLKLSQHMLDIGKEIEISPDASLDEFKAGLFKVRDSYINLIIKTTGITAKSDVYLDRDLKRLAGIICHSIDKNKYWFNQTNKDAIAKAFQNTIDITPSDTIKSNLQKALNSL